MASQLSSNQKNTLLVTNLLRKLSSVKNNRTKSGFVSILPNEDYNNIWSENNWTNYGKQFTSNKQFPLPGKTGITFDLNDLNKTNLPKNISKNIDKYCKNLEFLLYSPLNQEKQALKFKEAIEGLKMDNSTESDSENYKKFNPLFELKAYSCPKSLMEDFQSYFRIQSLGDCPMTVITFSFKTENDMATWNNQVDDERELVTKKFVNTAQEVCETFQNEGYWADFIDPSSGSLHRSPYTHATFYETDERYRHLGFEIIDNGCCKVISHHKWGTQTYVGCMLTNADLNDKLIQKVINKN